MSMDEFAIGMAGMNVPSWTTSASGAPALMKPDGTSVAVTGISAGYFTHIWVPNNHVATDRQIFDLRAVANGNFGAHLTPAEAWANLASGMVTTKDPVGGAADSSIILPGLDWDWLGGESLCVFWKGILTPETGNVGFMGSASNGGGVKGIEFRCLGTSNTGNTGRIQMMLYSPTQQSGPSTAATVPANPDPTAHIAGAGKEISAMFALNPVSRTVRVYGNGDYQQEFAIASIDTKGNSAFKLGTSAPIADGTAGMATQTRALVILKGRKNMPLPSTLDITARMLHRNASMLVSAEAW